MKEERRKGINEKTSSDQSGPERDGVCVCVQLIITSTYMFHTVVTDKLMYLLTEEPSHGGKEASGRCSTTFLTQRTDVRLQTFGRAAGWFGSHYYTERR